MTVSGSFRSMGVDGGELRVLAVPGARQVCTGTFPAWAALLVPGPS